MLKLQVNSYAYPLYMLPVFVYVLDTVIDPLPMLAIIVIGNLGICAILRRYSFFLLNFYIKMELSENCHVMYKRKGPVPGFTPVNV